MKFVWFYLQWNDHQELIVDLELYFVNDFDAKLFKKKRFYLIERKENRIFTSSSLSFLNIYLR